MSQTTWFTPQAIDAMNRAYRSAREILKEEGAAQDAYVKAGAKIMHMGRAGETDEHRLCVAAVEEALGRLPRKLDGAKAEPIPAP